MTKVAQNREAAHEEIWNDEPGACCTDRNQGAA